MRMRTLELSPEEASLIQFAIVHADELWKPEGSHFVPKDELTQKVLDKMAEVIDMKPPVDSGGGGHRLAPIEGQKENGPR